MTEEEKQDRAESYTTEDFAKLAENTMVNIMEMYSVISRLSLSRRKELANASSPNGQTVWALCALMNTTTMDIRRFTMGLGV